MGLDAAGGRIEERRRAALAAMAAGGSMGLAMFDQAEQAQQAQQQQALAAAQQQAVNIHGVSALAEANAPVEAAGATWQQALASARQSYAGAAATQQGMTDTYMRELGAAVPLHQAQVEGDVARLNAQYANQLRGQQMEWDRTRGQWDMDMQQRRFSAEQDQLERDYRLKMAGLEQRAKLSELTQPKELSLSEKQAAARGAAALGAQGNAAEGYGRADSTLERENRNYGRVTSQLTSEVAAQLRRYYPSLTETQANEAAATALNQFSPQELIAGLRNGSFSVGQREQQLPASRIAAGDAPLPSRWSVELMAQPGTGLTVGQQRLLTPDGAAVPTRYSTTPLSELMRTDPQVAGLMDGSGLAWAQRVQGLYGVRDSTADRRSKAADEMRSYRNLLNQVAVPADVQAQRDAYAGLFGSEYGGLAPAVAAGMFEAPTAAQQLADLNAQQGLAYAQDSLGRTGQVFTSPEDELSNRNATAALQVSQGDRALASDAGLDDPTVVPALRDTPDYQQASAIVYAALASQENLDAPVSEQLVRQLLQRALPTVPMQVIDLVVAENRSRFASDQYLPYSANELNDMLGKIIGG